MPHEIQEWLLLFHWPVTLSLTCQPNESRVYTALLCFIILQTVNLLQGKPIVDSGELLSCQMHCSQEHRPVQRFLQSVKILFSQLSPLQRSDSDKC